MSIPHLLEVRIALWQELGKIWRGRRAEDVIEKLAQRFQLTASERELRDPTGQRTFDHRAHSAVAQSRRVGWIEPVEVSGRGIWKLTATYFEDNPPLEGEEREELEQRLKAVEDVFDKLKGFILKVLPEES